MSDIGFIALEILNRKRKPLQKERTKISRYIFEHKRDALDLPQDAFILCLEQCLKNPKQRLPLEALRKTIESAGLNETCDVIGQANMLVEVGNEIITTDSVRGERMVSLGKKCQSILDMDHLGETDRQLLCLQTMKAGNDLMLKSEQLTQDLRKLEGTVNEKLFVDSYAQDPVIRKVMLCGGYPQGQNENYEQYLLVHYPEYACALDTEENKEGMKNCTIHFTKDKLQEFFGIPKISLQEKAKRCLAILSSSEDWFLKHPMIIDLRTKLQSCATSGSSISSHSLTIDYEAMYQDCQRILLAQEVRRKQIVGKQAKKPQACIADKPFEEDERGSQNFLSQLRRMSVAGEKPSTPELECLQNAVSDSMYNELSEETDLMEIVQISYKTSSMGWTISKLSGGLGAVGAINQILSISRYTGFKLFT